MRSINLSSANWRKGSYSNQDGGECVEVSDDFPAVAPVCDSKVPHGPLLVFPAGDCASFVSAIKGGQLTA
ncbi:DUF397 domain-containing protein [Streptomyces sp. ISL-43]|uniref:DUF397 domain-containing protein n=1 Tax=Streptomyces sp. ISL-43 TaxID=2819183 RepID=UPI001BE9CCB5|nr:DUF397 domain-containing protein [Streptomyces sp. ISL-43]MBT2452731.1 DUF397 domain-containing protein [Streptomyces sp. ISL-43]